MMNCRLFLSVFFLISVAIRSLYWPNYTFLSSFITLNSVHSPANQPFVPTGSDAAAQLNEMSIFFAFVSSHFKWFLAAFQLLCALFTFFALFKQQKRETMSKIQWPYFLRRSQGHPEIRCVFVFSCRRYCHKQEDENAAARSLANRTNCFENCLVFCFCDGFDKRLTQVAFELSSIRTNQQTRLYERSMFCHLFCAPSD